MSVAEDSVPVSRSCFQEPRAAPIPAVSLNLRIEEAPSLRFSPRLSATPTYRSSKNLQWRTRPPRKRLSRDSQAASVAKDLLLPTRKQGVELV
jgi:hypothetical protein